MVRVSWLPIFATCLTLAAQGPQPGLPGKRLSLQEAIQTSLRNNLQVDLAQQARQQTVAGILTQEGAFDWNLAASLQQSRTYRGSTLPIFIGYPALPYQTTSWTRGAAQGSQVLDLNKAFTWGGTLDVNASPAYNGWHSTTFGTTGGAVAAGTSSNPSPYTGTLTATYTQNFLRGFGSTVTTAPLVIALKNGKAADYTFQLALINLVSSTEGFYWNLVYAQRFLENKQLEQRLAQKHLAENLLRLKTGTIPRLDVTGSEAQVAQAEQDIIAAQTQLDNARDTLVRALYPNAERPASLEATDAPDLSHIQLSEDEAVKMALERRVELKSARTAADVSNLQWKVASDNLRPALSASAQYDGNSGTYTALGPVMGDLSHTRYPGYTLGVNFTSHLRNTAAQGNLAAAQATLASSHLTLRDQELSIILQTRTAVRNVEAAEKGVKAAEKTRYFQEKTLEAEHFKFANGSSTSFIILQDMTNLDNARSAEVQAQTAYANAVTALEQAVGNLLEARKLSVE